MAQQTGASQAPQASVTSLVSKDLREFPGKEGLMITVDYPQGAVDPIHRHNAHAFVYVLEGSIIMQVKGGKEVTLTPGQTFFEGPEDGHVVGRNASSFPVFVLGHSAGGVVSCIYALDHQSEIDGLICESFAYDLPVPDIALSFIKGLSYITPHTRQTQSSFVIQRAGITAVPGTGFDVVPTHHMTMCLLPGLWIKLRAMRIAPK